MMSGQRTRQGKSFLASRGSLIIGMVVLFFLSVVFGRTYYQNFTIQEEIRRLQEETVRLKAKKIETLEALKYVQSPTYVEEKARTELNLVKNGERVTVVLGGPATFATAIGQSGKKMINSDQTTNPQKWWKYFFGN